MLGLLVCLAALGAAPQAEARYASIVVDFATGRVLHQANADTRNYPASLAKMMTLYLAFEALDRGNLTMGQELPISRRAAGMGPARLGLRAGKTITVKNVILALIVKSANDSAVVMAEALAGRETRFAKLMTKKARALGMKRTSFRNASGLPNRRQLSTARDMVILARALIRDFPHYYDLFSTAKFRYGGRVYRTHNGLLKKYHGADGLKTGYIRASGFNLAASAVRGGRRLVAVVFGGKSPRSRDRHVARLLDRSFSRLVAQRPATPPTAPPAPPQRKPESVVAAAPRPAAGNADRVSRAAAKPPIRAWGVQVGAYYRYGMARKAAVRAVARVPALLASAPVSISDIKGRRGRIYRARVVGLTEVRARAACNRLAAMDSDCLVVRARRALAFRKPRGAVAAN